MDHEDRKRNFMTWYLLAAMIGVFLFQFLWIKYLQVETVPYSRFTQLVNDGKVDEVTVSQDSIQGTLKQALPDGRRAFVTNRVDPQLADKLEAHGVTVTGAPSGGLVATLLSWSCPRCSFISSGCICFVTSPIAGVLAD